MNQESKTGNTIFSSSLKMAVATFSSRILGLVREQSMAAIFGASGMTDAFLVAYRIPNILRDLFAEGAFSSAFVPTFTKTLHMDEQRAKSLMWSLFILLGGITLSIGVGIAIFSDQLVMLFAPKFIEDPHKFHVTSTLIMMMSPFLAFISIAALFMGVLNALKVFFLPSFAPVFFNIAMIASILTLPQFMKQWGTEPIYAVGIGVLVGGFLQLIVQLPLIIKKGFGPQGPIRLKSAENAEVVSRIGIGTIGIAATQINVLVNTILASATVVGAVSWLVYAFRFFQFPVGILGVSVASSNLVHFSHAWKKGDHEQAKSLLKASYDLSLFVILPAMAMMFALSAESVNLIFEHGAFTRQDTLMASLALRYYLIGLPFYGLYKIFAPVFYTLDKPKIPVIISTVAVGLNIAFCVLMVPHYGFWILALGTSLSMIFNTLTQMVLLKGQLGLTFNFFFPLKLFKLMIISICMYLSIVYIGKFLYNFDDSTLIKVFHYAVLFSLGVFVYFGGVVLLGEKKVINQFLKR
jgi:putative peptidoglycan lipid II flippase